MKALRSFLLGVMVLLAIAVVTPQFAQDYTHNTPGLVGYEAWKIVDGTLYLNLDKDVQKKWAKDIPGYIKKADANWPTIKDKAAGDL